MPFLMIGHKNIGDKNMADIKKILADGMPEVEGIFGAHAMDCYKVGIHEGYNYAKQESCSEYIQAKLEEAKRDARSRIEFFFAEKSKHGVLVLSDKMLSELLDLI